MNECGVGSHARRKLFFDTLTSLMYTIIHLIHRALAQSSQEDSGHLRLECLDVIEVIPEGTFSAFSFIVISPTARR